MGRQKEGGASVALPDVRSSLAHELLHMADDRRVEERLPRGEVPVDRAHAESGVSGNLVERSGEPFGPEDPARHLLHAPAIALGVGPEQTRLRRGADRPITAPLGVQFLASSSTSSTDH